MDFKAALALIDEAVSKAMLTREQHRKCLYSLDFIRSYVLKLEEIGRKYQAVGSMDTPESEVPADQAH